MRLPINLNVVNLIVPSGGRQVKRFAGALVGIILSGLIIFMSAGARGEIPTVTLGTINGASTLTKPTYYSLTNSFFAFPGVRTAKAVYNGTNYFYPIGDAVPQGVMMPMKVAFNINAQEFEVLCFGGYPHIMVYNPPDYTPYTNALLSAMGQGYTLVRVQFSSKASRNIIFYLSGSQGNYIGGVNVQQGDTISTNTLGPRKTLEILGDSYTEGYSQSDSYSRWLGGFPMQLERMFTNVDVIPSGEGGTGYLNPGPNVGETNYAGRFFTDVVSNNPNYLLISGGLNDANQNYASTQFYSAVSNLFSMAVANLPNTKIAVIGNFYTTSYYPPFNLPSTIATNYDHLIGQAATSFGLPFIDPIANNWLNLNNFTEYMGNDNIHPTVFGYTVIASNLQASLPPTFSALGVTSNIYNLAANLEAVSTNTVSITSTNPISTNVANSASATFTASTTSGGAPLGVNFNYSGTNGTSFVWSFGDGGSSTNENPSYTYYSSGNYTVGLTVNGSVTNIESNLILVTNTPAVQLPTNGVLNVTNYGAVGDAVQFYVNTVSNSVLVTTTTQMPSTSIGEAIEIFQAGTQTYGVNSYGTNAYGNQDLVTTITNIVNGTNIYISLPAQNTLVNAFATYGHDNRVNLQNAINAAGTNSTVYIPAGNYLVLAATNAGTYGYVGLTLAHGGITISGAGTNITRLTGEGAWGIRSVFGTQSPWRGVLFEEDVASAHNLPVVLENMTLDGGVQQGNTSVHGIRDNAVDGLGWDMTHDAFLVWSYNNAPVFDQMTWTNLVFEHWRGEIVKSLDQSTNGNLYVVNCVFNDGNATAINIYPSINFTNCLFNNLFQVAEYYQAYSTNTCYFQNNICTNITGNGFAINGGKGNNPPFVIKNNTFYLSGYGNNGIETVPADNVLISSNQFICANYANAIVLGSAGYQGTYDNSNIVIAANTIVNPFLFLEIAGSTTIRTQMVEDVVAYGNVLKNPASGGVTFMTSYGLSTNIFVYSNDCSQFMNLASIAVNYVPSSGQFPLLATNNSYWTTIYTYSAGTNLVNYGNGSRYMIVGTQATGVACTLVDTNGSQIPSGAQILIYNQNSSKATIPVYLNSAMTGSPVGVGYQQSFAATWINNQWVYTPPSSSQAGASPILQVTPGTWSFGTIMNGTSSTNLFTVTNAGGGTLSGSASVAAPFSILSGGTYNLSSGQSQAVSVVFNPATATSYSQILTFTGGAGTNLAVSGISTNAASGISPTVSAITANTPNLVNNPAMYSVNNGQIQLSATAKASGSDPITWQWWYNAIGQSPVVFQRGTGTAPTAAFTNPSSMDGATNIWTLQVVDTKNGRSAQSQLILHVLLQSPQGVHFQQN